MNTKQSKISESDRVVLDKLSELGNTRYRKIIEIAPKLMLESKSVNYSTLKLNVMKKTVRKLWVELGKKGETAKVFDAFERFEKILFGSGQGRARAYRGHFVHQFDVFLLGYYILNKILENEKLSVHSKFHHGARQEEVFTNPNFTWMLAATFHDMGYPIERIDFWFSDFLKDFLKIETQYQVEVEKIFPPIFSEYISLLSKWHEWPTATRLDAMNDTGLFRNWPLHNILETNLRKKDHGVVSSLLLMHSLLTKEIVSRNRAWLNGPFNTETLPACHAIAVHNIDSDELKINLSEYPYAFLLMLCDSIQDWERSQNSKDYSQLVSMTFSDTNDIPELRFVMRINKKEKIDEFMKLEHKLNAGHLIKILIMQENGDQICTLS